MRGPLHSGRYGNSASWVLACAILAVGFATSWLDLTTTVSAQSDVLRHVVLPLGAPGSTLNNPDQYGIRFRNRATGQFVAPVVVEIPRPGFDYPQDPDGNLIDGAPGPGAGLCLPGTGGADCKQDLEMVFPTGATNVQFDVVGGYTDTFCLSWGTINGSDTLVTWAADLLVRFENVNLFYQWTRRVGPLNDPSRYINSVEVQGSQRTDFCGLGYNTETGQHAGGIAIASIEYDVVVPPGQLVFDILDPACDTPTNCPGTLIEPATRDGNLVADRTRLAAASVLRTAAVADGATRLLLRARTDEPVLFSMSVTPSLQSLRDPGFLTTPTGDLPGSSLVAEPVAGDGWAFAVYHVPTEIFDPFAMEAAVTLTVRQISQPTVWTEKIVRLVRPLPVLVHGVWSGPGIWDALASHLTQNGYPDCPECRVDYGKYDGGAPSFDPAAPSPPINELRKTYAAALSKQRSTGVAATQVAIVAHSMGGLVARARASQDTYRSSANYYQGEFQKVITIGTPHRGSPFADWIIANRCTTHTVAVTGHGVPVVVSETLEDYFASSRFFGPIGPAIFGFQTRGAPIDHITDTTLPGHAVVGIAPDNSTVEWLFDHVGSLFGGVTVDGLLSGNGNHDTIVTRLSQMGGLTRVPTVSHVTNVVHAGSKEAQTLCDGCIVPFSETDHPAAMAEMASLLGARITEVANPESAKFGAFDRRFSNATVPQHPGPACQASSSALTARDVSGTVTLSPASGTVIAPGATVPVTFTVSGVPIAGAFVTVGGFVTRFEGSGPFVVDYHAPADRVGRIDIVAETFGPAVVQHRGQSFVTALRSDSPSELSAVPANILMTFDGERHQLAVAASYPGATLDVTSTAGGTTFATLSGGAAVVAILENGLLEARGEGQDVVLITHRGLSASVPVSVTIPNRQPALGAIADVSLNGAGALTIPLIASDPDGDALRITGNLPSFATIVDNGDGTGSLAVNPLPADAGEYQVSVTASDDGYPAAETSRAFVIQVTAAPSITLQPTNQQATTAQVAQFTVGTSGTPQPGISWQVSTNGGASWTAVADGATYSGATTPTLSVANPTMALNGAQYRALAINSLGSATSAAATLTVTLAGTGPGQIDATFGAGGRVTTAFFDARHARANAAAVQPDGRIVVVGEVAWTNEPASTDFGIARYNPDGSLDTSFGTGGIVVSDFAGHADAASAGALQPDGKIVVGGYHTGASPPAGDIGRFFAVVRYLPSGVLDPAFGNQGKVTTFWANVAWSEHPFTNCEWLSEVRALVVQPDGRIVALGTAWDGYLFSYSDLAFVRYLPDGSPDPSVQSNVGSSTLGPCGAAPPTGVYIEDLTERAGDYFQDDLVRDAVLLPDGKILVVGRAFNPGSETFLMRFQASNGRPDPTFGSNGLVVVDTDWTLDDERPNAVALQADGQIVVGGMALDDIDTFTWASAIRLARFTAGGALDPSFGHQGVTRYVNPQDSPYRFNSGAADLAIETGGRIVTVGGTDFPDPMTMAGPQPDFRVTRFTTAGAVDGLFNGSGSTTTDFFGGTDDATATVLTAAGEIVAAGYATKPDGSRVFALTRYLSGGTCSYTVSGPTGVLSGNGVSGLAIFVTTASGCVWTGMSNAPWITLSNAPYHTDPTIGGTGPSYVLLAVEANPSPVQRSGTVTVAGTTLTITQGGMTAAPVITLHPVSQSVAPGQSATLTCGASGTPAPAYQWQFYIPTIAFWVSLGDGGSIVSGTQTPTLTINSPGFPNGNQYRCVATNSIGAATSNAATVTFNNTCTFTLGAQAVSFDAAAATSTVSVTTAPGCGWTAVSNNTFASITGGSAGTGSGTVSYSVTANTSGANTATAARSGSLTIAGKAFIISQSGCSFATDTAGSTLGAAASMGSVGIIAPNGCSWSVTGLPAWTTTSSGGSGTGAGRWSYTLAANSTGTLRSQQVGVAGLAFQLRQLGADVRPMTPGTTASFALSNNAEQRWFSFEMVGGRSYCARVSAGRTAGNPSTPAVSAYRANATTLLGSGMADAHACFIAPLTETGLIRVDQQEDSVHPYVVAIGETTLWANWYFIGGGYSSYTLLKNTSKDPLPVSIIWRGPDGAVVGSDNLVVPANGIVFRDARVVAIGATAGSVEVSHAAAPDALVGSQTTLSPATGLSFDTILMRRVRW